MKTRITVTLDPETVAYIQKLAKAEKVSRSEAVEEIIRRQKGRHREAELESLAQKFFAAEIDQEREETAAFQRLGLEVIASED